ncbi:hypothetical protein [Nocardia sp. NPDC050710]|uniref:hypothetical protein n=1 Tax=Nocardia sp. NPDC050710 TaxID=3157220 RepID=UPI00340B73EF
MSPVSVLAARLRGAMTGAVAGAAALAAHGIGGGMVPTGSSLVMLVAGCAAVGVVGAGQPGPRLSVLVGQLGAGQLIGHIALTVASGHSHPMVSTPTMSACHVVFAVVVGITLSIAERLMRTVLSSVYRWLALLIGRARTCTGRPCVAMSARNSVARDLLLGSGSGNRGPPMTVAAVRGGSVGRAAHPDWQPVSAVSR